MKLFGALTSRTLRLRRKTEKQLEQYTRPSTDFFVLIGFASALAVLGLIMNNAAIVIGAMVVAPLITPVFGFSLGLLIGRVRRMSISLWTITLGTILSLVVSVAVTLFVLFVQEDGIVLTNEILSRTAPDLLFFLVALISGMVGAYAYVRHGILERIAGIAISVAIIPPLAVVGMQLALFNLHLAQQSFVLYVLNLLGICFGSILMFIFLGFGNEIESK